MGRYTDDHESPIYVDPWIGLGLAGYALAYFLLSFSVDWPEGCDIPTGGRQTVSRLIAEFTCVDLWAAGWDEKALLILLWSVPIAFMALVLRARHLKKNNAHTWD